MRSLDALRGATNDNLVHVLYESVEKSKSALESDAYCEMMNALLVVRERLHASEQEEEEERERPPTTHSSVRRVVARVAARPISSELEREQRLLDALSIKHEIERDVIDLRRAYREGREALSRSLHNILKLIRRLETIPLVIEEEPIVL